MMKDREGETLSRGKRRFLAIAGIALFAVPIVAGVLSAQSQAMPDWQTVAGGKMSFDVASIKQNKSDDEGMSQNFPLSIGPNFAPVGTLFSVTNAPVRTLISFAY